MNNNFDRTKTATARFSTRAIALMLFFVMLLTAIGSGSVISAIATEINSTVSADAIPEAATEGGKIALNAIPSADADTSSDNAAADSNSATLDTDNFAIDSDHSVVTPDLSGFVENEIVRGLKQDIAATGWNDASTGIVLKLDGSKYTWYKVSNAYSNFTLTSDMNDLHYQVVVSDTWYGNKSGSNNYTFHDSEAYNKEYYAERDSSNSYDLSANFLAGKYVFHLKAEPANNQAKYELYRKKALYDGGNDGEEWTNGQNMAYDGSTNDGDRYKITITGDGNRKMFRTRYVDGSSSTNYRPYGNGGQTGSANAVGVNINSGSFNSFANGYAQKTSNTDGNPDNYFYFDTRTGYTYTVWLQGGKVWLTTDDPGAEPLDTPAITINGSSSSAAINIGGSATINWAAITNAGSYSILKDGVEVGTSNTNSYTISDSASVAGTYTVVAKPADGNNNYLNSDPSNGVDLTRMSPQFYLVGDVGSDAFSTVNGDSTESNYDPDNTAKSQDAETYAQRWTTAYNVLKINTPVVGSPGKYSITLTTKDVSWAINVGLYDGGNEDQYGFKVGDKYYNKPNADYTVPYSGIVDNDECYAILGEGSLVIPANTTVTIYVDQTDNNKITVETNRVDVKTVARVKNYSVSEGHNTPTLGNPTNATAAIGTATVTYDSGTNNVKPATATLTATVNDNAYEFVGWYKDQACTTAAEFAGNTNASVTLTGINNSVTYYALFSEIAARDYAFTITCGTNGSFTALDTTNSIGIKDGSSTTGHVYKGGTIIFTTTPSPGYEVDTVTSSSGSVDYQITDHEDGKSTVTISNIIAAANINVTFKKATTNTLTFVIGDETSLGSNFTVTYIDENGSKHTSAAVSDGATIKAIQGTDITITANAAADGSFNGWHFVGSYQRSKDTPLSGATVKIRAESDLTITALFAEKAAGTSSKYTVDFTNANPDTVFSSFESVSLGDLSNWQNKTIYKATVTATVTDSNTNFIIKDTTNTIEYKFESNAISVNNEYWPKDPTQNYSNANQYGRISLTSGTTYYFYVFENKYRDNDSSKAKELGLYISTTDLMPGGGSGGSGDSDDIDKSQYQKLYVLDGIDTNGNFGTRTFGNTEVISSSQGLAKSNIFDQDESENIYHESYGDEGALLYYYDPDSNLDFRVSTTIADGHRAIGVRAYVVNGITYMATKADDGTYYADITLDADDTLKEDESGHEVLELIPVYYNTLIPDRDYIKFYVDSNTITQTGWGKNIGYSLWYKTTSEHGFEGGYPGQPLMSDGNLLYGYFPKYYVGNDATKLPASANYNRFNGVLLSNLAEHNSTHLAVLNEWGASLNANNCNYQSFDYLDPVEISNIGDSDMIEFVVKYGNKMTQPFKTTYNSRTLYNLSGGQAWPSGSVAAPTSIADALGTDFEYLQDIDGNRVNILNEHDVEFNDQPIYVVSAGNQDSSSFPALHSSNTWDTVWNLYDSNASGAATGDSLIAVRPVDFINPSTDLSTRLTAAFGPNYQNRPVLIHYEDWLAGDSNSGTRLDGRWLYTRSSDSTNVRLRVATDDGSGNLTFSDQFINWAEISDGHVNGPKETNDALTKKLELDNRTTEVTAKINPVNYKVKGFYMLGAAYSSDVDNGFSSDLSDYNKLKANGTAYSFTNTQNNRMVIVVERIPASNLTLLHQMYGGPGATKIDGVFKSKIELADANGDVIQPSANSKNKNIYGNYSTKMIELKDFTDDAPHGGSVKQLKVTIRTEMYAGTVFNQWYEDDKTLDPPYRMLDPTMASGVSAHGLATPVEKVIYVNVDDLYTAIEEEGSLTGGYSLSTQSLNYYSDIQSNATVQVNHFLLDAAAGMTANTYVHVQVIDSTGSVIEDYGNYAQSTSVPTTYLSKQYAENGYQLYIEIWTDPTGYTGFTDGDFYRPDASNNSVDPIGYTKIATGSVDPIYYTNNLNDKKTVNSKTYQYATATVPISYFFKQTVDGGKTVTIFDTDKKQFNLYSKLEDLRGELDITHQLYRDDSSTGTAKTYITVDRLDKEDNLIKTEILKTETLQANEYKVHLGKNVITPDTEDKLQITLTCELGNWTDFVQFDKMVESVKSELTIYDALDVTATVSINEDGAIEKTATILFRISNLFNQDKTQRVTHLDFLSEVVQPEFKYEITYLYNPYVASYGEQSYFKKGTFTQAELDSFMVYDNHSKLDFKSDGYASQKSFISSKAPMEDNFMETLSYKNYETAVVSYDNLRHDHTVIITVQPKSTKSQIRVTLQLPYAITSNTTYSPKVEANNIVNKTALNPYQRTTPMYGWLVTSGKQGPDSTEEGDPQFISAPLLLWNTSENRFEHFVYWKVQSLGTSANSSKEYTRCYDYEFNFALFQDCIITPVYESGEFDATKMPSPPTSWNMYERFDPYVMKNSDTSGFNGATITFIENSRNQYNHNGCGNLDPSNGGVPLSRQGAADRIYTDFLLSFNNAIPGIDNLQTAGEGKYKCGVVVEAAGTLTEDSQHEGEYIVESEATYASNFAEGVDKTKISNYIKSGTGSGMMKSEFDATQLDDKNRLKYYVGFNNRSPQAAGNDENPAELPDTYMSTTTRVLRAYSYIYKVGDLESTIQISDPTYFTIYGIGSVKDGKAETE